MSFTAVDSETVDTFARLLDSGLISYSDLVENGFDEIAMELMVARSVRFKKTSADGGITAATTTAPSPFHQKDKRLRRLADDGDDDDDGDDRCALHHQHQTQQGGGRQLFDDTGFFHKRLASSRTVLRKRAANEDNISAAVVSPDVGLCAVASSADAHQQSRDHDVASRKLEVVCGTTDVAVARRQVGSAREHDDVSNGEGTANHDGGQSIRKVARVEHEL